MVERWSPKPNVEGSSPSVPVIKRHSEYSGCLFVLAVFCLNKKIYEKEIYAISYFCFKLYENFFHKRLTCCIIKIDWNKSEI